MLHEISSAEQIGFPILSALIALPLLWALLLLLVRGASRRRALALVGAGAELLLACSLALHFIPRTSDVQFVERSAWIPSLHATYHVGVDGISVLFIPLTAFLFFVILLSSWSAGEARQGAHLAVLFALEAITIGVFSALDLVLFFVFWELMLVPLYFLVSAWGVGPERRAAALKLVIYMLAGSAPLLVGILLLGINHHDAMRAAGLAPECSFDYLTLLRTPISPRLQTTIFVLLLVGFAVKSPLFPFHTWLPATVLEGPASVGVLMTGLKLGTYGMIRFVLPFSPDGGARWLAILGAIGVVYGALIALVQTNLRRMLAFSSISHVGLVVIGIASRTEQGLQGALVQMISIGFIAAGLMLLVGFLHHRTSSSELSSLGGVAQRAPLLAGYFLLLGAASIGLPGTNGFPGEHLILAGAFRDSGIVAVAGLAGVVLGAACLLVSFERAFLGPAVRPVVSTMRDLVPRERLVISALALAVLVLGLWPAPLLDVTGASIAAILGRVRP